MAKKRTAKRTSKPKAKSESKSKAKKGGKTRAKKKTAAQIEARKKRIRERLELHRAATMLSDFHGGKGPVKSGCGRPRGS